MNDNNPDDKAALSRALTIPDNSAIRLTAQWTAVVHEISRLRGGIGTDRAIGRAMALELFLAQEQGILMVENPGWKEKPIVRMAETEKYRELDEARMPQPKSAAAHLIMHPSPAALKAIDTIARLRGGITRREAMEHALKIELAALQTSGGDIVVQTTDNNLIPPRHHYRLLKAYRWADRIGLPELGLD